MAEGSTPARKALSSKALAYLDGLATKAGFDAALSRSVARLFGEGPGGFVVSGPPEALERLGECVALDIFGTVGGDALDVTSGDVRIVATLAELREAHGALAALFP